MSDCCGSGAITANTPAVAHRVTEAAVESASAPASQHPLFLTARSRVFSPARLSLHEDAKEVPEDQSEPQPGEEPEPDTNCARKPIREQQRHDGQYVGAGKHQKQVEHRAAGIIVLPQSPIPRMHNKQDGSRDSASNKRDENQIAIETHSFHQNLSRSTG